MIKKLEACDALRFVKCLGSSCTAMRIKTAYACYGLSSPMCGFYLVDNSAAFAVMGKSVLHCGDKIADIDELTAFLEAIGAQSFISENMLLQTWTPAPRLLMRCTKAMPRIENIEIEENPDLWALSKTVEGVDTDEWYSDACTRKNKTHAAVRAVKQNGEYVALVYAQCIAPDGIYLTSVQTLPKHRKKGYAKALLSSFCNGETVYLICKPEMRHFYEKCGFSLAIPICEYVKN